MEAARYFLSRVLPWEGNNGAYMNIHYSYTKEGEPKLLWYGYACTELDDMVSKVKWVRDRDNTQGVYVCMSSQRTADLKQFKNGKNYYAAVRSLPNAVRHKSFYLDIDVKEKAYADTEAARIAFFRFLNAAGIPFPTFIVASGSGGFHVHWLIREPISSAEWRPYSEALANAVKRYGLIADTGCTVDAARILRIPDTYNKKGDSPVSVKILWANEQGDYENADLFKAFEPYLSAVPNPQDAFARPASATVLPMDRLGAGVESRPVNLNDVAKECGFVSTALDTGGKEYSNPLWNLTTLLSIFTTDPRENAHRMAKGHPTYTRKETDEQFETKLRYHTERNLGWPSCKTIASNGCTACATCKHRDEGKSPLNFDNYVPPPPFVEEALPKGYIRDPATYLIHKRKMEEDGAVTPGERVSINEIYNVRLRDDQAIIFNSKSIEFAVPFTALATAADLRRCLLGQGFTVQESETKELGKLLVSWITQLKETKAAVMSSIAFGWTKDGFTYAGVTHTPTGERPASKSQLAEYYTPSGSLDKWKQASNLVTDQQRPALDAILACAFAGPLVKLTGQDGAFVSAYSLDSGIGKTTALRTGAAVWGHGVGSVQSAHDTDNYVMKKIRDLQNLPVFWDEIKTEDDFNKITKLQFALTGGKNKGRLKSTTDYQDVGTWQTLLIVASNATLLDQISKTTNETAAGLYRLFEFEVPKAVNGHGKIAVGDASQIIGNLRENYGHAGVTYAKYLGANEAAIRERVIRVYNALFEKYIGTEDERYWFVCITTIFLGASYANELGLTQIDINRLGEFLIATLRRMRGEREEHTGDATKAQNIEATLTQYLSAKRARYTLLTKTMWLTKGKPTGVYPVDNFDMQRVDSAQVHISFDGYMRLAETPLRQWLREHKHSETTFIKKLKDDLGFKPMRETNLGSGTPCKTGKQPCLQADAVSSSWLRDYLDLSEEPKGEDK